MLLNYSGHANTKCHPRYPWTDHCWQRYKIQTITDNHTIEHLKPFRYLYVCFRVARWNLLGGGVPADDSFNDIGRSRYSVDKSSVIAIHRRRTRTPSVQSGKDGSASLAPASVQLSKIKVHGLRLLKTLGRCYNSELATRVDIGFLENSFAFTFCFTLKKWRLCLGRKENLLKVAEFAYREGW